MHFSGTAFLFLPCKNLKGTNENSRNLAKQKETTGDGCKNGRCVKRRFFDKNRKIFRDFNFHGLILTANFHENWKTAKISTYTVLVVILKLGRR